MADYGYEGEEEQQNYEGGENQEYQNEEQNQEPQENQEEQQDYNQEQNDAYQNNENQYQPEQEEPQKTYNPPNPSIKDCIKLNQILPIKDIDKNIEAISSVVYENDDLLNEFLQKVDSRINICNDDPNGPFITCEQNRDGESYRSPWSNKYYPNTDDAKYPSTELRKLEEKLNEMIKVYTKSYYLNSGICSAYCWELGESASDGLGVAVLIKNTVGKSHWDSSNVVTITFENKNGKLTAKYYLVTTVSLTLGIEHKNCGNISFSGTNAKTASCEKVIKNYYDEVHIQNIGTLIEEIEGNIKSDLENIYIAKTKYVIGNTKYGKDGKPNIEGANKLKAAFLKGK